MGAFDGGRAWISEAPNHLGLYGKHVAYSCDVQLSQVAEVRNSISKACDSGKLRQYLVSCVTRVL